MIKNEIVFVSRLDNRLTDDYKFKVSKIRILNLLNAQVAQLVEQRTENPRVGHGI